MSEKPLSSRVREALHHCDQHGCSCDLSTADEVAKLEEELLRRNEELDRIHQKVLEAAAVINVKHGDWMGMFQNAAREKEETRKAFDIIWQLTNLPFSDTDRKKIQGIALAYAGGEGPQPGSEVWHWIGKS